MVRRRRRAGQRRSAQASYARAPCDDRATTTPVSAAALDDVEVDDEHAWLAAESLVRRQADLEIHHELARAGCCGPSWDRYAEELARYGYAVMLAWLQSGEMFSQCKAKGCGLGPPPPEWTVDDRTGLANETVALAVNSFKQKLIEGRWTPDGGATLRTYFIGGCVFEFPNLYRKWLTDRAALQRQQPMNIERDTDDRSNPSQDPCEIAINKLRADEAFNSIPDDRTKSVVLLQAIGYTYAEIGEILQITSRAVDGIIRRQHERGSRWRSS